MDTTHSLTPPLRWFHSTKQRQDTYSKQRVRTQAAGCCREHTVSPPNSYPPNNTTKATKTDLEAIEHHGAGTGLAEIIGVVHNHRRVGHVVIGHRRTAVIAVLRHVVQRSVLVACRGLSAAGSW